MNTVSALAVWAMIAATACSASPARDRAAKVPKVVSSQLVRDYPAAALVPGDATYALVVRRPSDLVTAASELAKGLSLLLPGVTFPFFGKLAERLALFDMDELSVAGVDVKGSATVFSSGLYPTLVLPIESADRFASYIDSHVPRDGLVVRRLGEVELYSLPTLGVSWMVTGHWLAATIEPHHDAEAWARSLEQLAASHVDARVERLLTTARSAVAAALPGEVAPTAGAQPAAGSTAVPGVVGAIRLAQLRKVLGAAAELASCMSALPPLSTISIGVNIRWSKGGAQLEGAIAAQLTPNAASSLERVIGPAVPPGYRSFRAGSAISVDLGVDLLWLASLGRRSGCVWLPPMKSGFLKRIGADSIRTYHLAVADLRVAKRAGKIAAHMSLRDSRFIDSLLQRIPLRSRLERNVNIGGSQAKRIRVPFYPSFTYRLTPLEFIAAVGDGVMERVLEDGEAGRIPVPEGRTIVAAAIYPHRLPELVDTLKAAGKLIGMSANGYFRQAAAKLMRYEHGSVRLSLQGRKLVLRAGMQLW